MGNTSDLQLDISKFDPANEDEKTKAVNEKLIEITKNGPSWVEVGAPAYRQMRLDGKTPFPKPTVLPHGQAIEIPSREAGRTVPCRIFHPRDTDKKACKGVIMHIHGGGWVLMSHETSDPLLERYANNSDCATISVGYRLSPEHPFPAGPEDCYDVAEWLVDNAEAEFGGPLKFIGGESAGGHLSLLSCYHLLRTRRAHKLSGLLLHFGVFDLSFLPKAISFPLPLVLNHTSMDNFLKAFVPQFYPPNTVDKHSALKSPEVSPFYQDLENWRGVLPAALFTCGSQDCLLEDTVFMASKWAMAGGKQVLKIVEGGCHGYIAFPPSTYPPAMNGMEATLSFIKEAMSSL